MMLRASTCGLQEELRATNRHYQEEKAGLRANLATLRLDLAQLHRDDRTVTTDETTSYAASHLSFPASSDAEPELKRLVEEDEDDAKTLRSEAGGGGHGTGGPLDKLPALKGSTKGPTVTTKSLRFSSNTAGGKSKPGVGYEDISNSVSARKSFLKDDWWEESNIQGDADLLGMAASHNMGQESKEQLKFKELQKNQDILRNIGRAQLREKRLSLIRLPTITSAKKRGQTTWDSGQNVSRPAGKSTVFETHPYVEASSRMKKRNFKIPSVRDPHRSEVELGPDTPRQPDASKKKRVQFTRPGEINFNASMMNSTTNTLGVFNTTSTSMSAATSFLGSEDRHNESIMGGESLNTTLADTTLDDSYFQDASFDEDQIKALALRGSIDKGTAAATGMAQMTEAQKQQYAAAQTVKDTADDSGQTVTARTNDALAKDQLPLPAIKVKTLMKKNVLLHDLNTSGVSLLGVGAGGALGRPGNWDKASDMSVLTKVSRLSLETEEWKNNYMSVPDPDKRKKTLSDIMFAVRSRMRENEMSLRFGETPRPKDEPYDFLLPDPFPQPSPRRAGKVHRKPGKVQKGRGGMGVKAPKSQRGPTGADPQGGGKAAGVQIQGYLRRLYRHRRGGGGSGSGGNGGSGRSGNGGSGRKAGGRRVAAKPCSQEANKLERRRHQDTMRLTVPQHA